MIFIFVFRFKGELFHHKPIAQPPIVPPSEPQVPVDKINFEPPNHKMEHNKDKVVYFAVNRLYIALYFDLRMKRQ